MTTKGPKAVTIPAARQYASLDADQRRFFDRAAHAAMGMPPPAWFVPLMPEQPTWPNLPELKTEGEAVFFNLVATLIAPDSQPGMEGTPGNMTVVPRQNPEQRRLGNRWTPENLHTHQQLSDLGPVFTQRLREYAQSLLDYQDDCNEWTRLYSEELLMQWPTYYAWRQLEEIERRASDAWSA